MKYKYQQIQASWLSLHACILNFLVFHQLPFFLKVNKDILFIVDMHPYKTNGRQYQQHWCLATIVLSDITVGITWLSKLVPSLSTLDASNTNTGGTVHLTKSTSCCIFAPSLAKYVGQQVLLPPAMADQWASPRLLEQLPAFSYQINSSIMACKQNIDNLS